MKVHVLKSTFPYTGHWIDEGVFSTKKKANIFLKKLKKNSWYINYKYNNDCFKISSFELDDMEI